MKRFMIVLFTCIGFVLALAALGVAWRMSLAWIAIAFSMSVLLFD